VNDLRRKRLLILASGSAWHKCFYSQYCQLINEGLIRWVIGTAFLTELGKEKLEELQSKG